MISSQYKSGIETVLVTTGGRMLDCVSFAGRRQAESYKRGVRRWAHGRGVTIQVTSQMTAPVTQEFSDERTFALAG